MLDVELVSLNHEPCLQVAKEVAEGAVISVCDMGRTVLSEACGILRKGRFLSKLDRTGDEMA